MHGNILFFLALPPLHMTYPQNIEGLVGRFRWKHATAYRLSKRIYNNSSSFYLPIFIGIAFALLSKQLEHNSVRFPAGADIVHEYFGKKISCRN